MEEDPVKLRVLCPQGFRCDEANGGGYGEEYERIIVPCHGKLSVERGMECPLKAASGTVIACEGFECAVRHERRRRFGIIIEYQYDRHNDNGRNDRGHCLYTGSVGGGHF